MMAEKPVYNLRLVKATGAGEQCEVVFAAKDAGELRTRLASAVKVVTERMQANNEQVLEMSTVVDQKIQALRAVIRAEERAKLEAEGKEAPSPDAAPSGPVELRPDQGSGA